MEGDGVELVSVRGGHGGEMLQTLRPAVVGHFDPLRLLDTDGRERLARPAIGRRIRQPAAAGAA